MPELSRRSFLGATAGAAGGVGVASTGVETAEAGLLRGDLHTHITYRALVDAVVPRTPGLEAELGPEHVPGGIGIGLDNFMIEYVNNMFTLEVPFLSEDSNLQLADPFASILDVVAWKLVIWGDAESGLDLDRPKSLFSDHEATDVDITLKAGAFSKLDRRDRLRAIAILDDFEVELSVGDTFFELDAGMVGQLVIGFTEAVYYSEWQGYDEYFQPPSEREHPNTPTSVQGWRQTDFPGFADGKAALRGYMSVPGSELGEGETWKRINDGAEITMQSGEFTENDYDTSDYEEPFPVEDDEDDSDDDDGWFGGGDGGDDDEGGIGGGGGPGFTLPAVGTALGGAAAAKRLLGEDETAGDTDG